MKNPTTYLESWQPPRSLRTINFSPFIWKCKLFSPPPPLYGNLALLSVWIAFYVQQIPLETYLERSNVSSILPRKNGYSADSNYQKRLHFGCQPPLHNTQRLQSYSSIYLFIGSVMQSVSARILFKAYYCNRIGCIIFFSIIPSLAW